MADDELQLLQGTLDVLVLKALSGGPRHGYAVARWIREVSAAFTVEDRALYIALHRLEERGWLEAEWGLSENNRRAKFYGLTREGKRQLAAEAERWYRYADGVARVLEAAPGEAS